MTSYRVPTRVDRRGKCRQKKEWKTEERMVDRREKGGQKRELKTEARRSDRRGKCRRKRKGRHKMEGKRE